MLMIGCDDFIPKPFQEELLLQKIAKYTGVKYIYEFEQNTFFSDKNINAE